MALLVSNIILQVFLKININFSNSSPKKKEHSHLFYTSSINLTSPSYKEHYKKRKLKANISDKHRCKNPQPPCI